MLSHGQVCDQQLYSLSTKLTTKSQSILPMHYNKSQQVSQLSASTTKRHEHTFCNHFDIETFRGVRAPQPGIEWTSNGKHWFQTGYVDMPCLSCSYYSNLKTQVWLCQRKLFVSKNNRFETNGKTEFRIWNTSLGNTHFFNDTCSSNAKRFAHQKFRPSRNKMMSFHSTTWHRMKFKWHTLISERLRGHAISDLFLLKSKDPILIMSKEIVSP